MAKRQRENKFHLLTDAWFVGGDAIIEGPIESAYAQYGEEHLSRFVLRERIEHLMTTREELEQDLEQVRIETDQLRVWVERERSERARLARTCEQISTEVLNLQGVVARLTQENDEAARMFMEERARRLQLEMAGAL